MSNPFFKGTPTAANPLAAVTGLIGAISNPSAAMQSLLAANPNNKQLMQQAQTMAAGKSPQELQAMVMQLANQNGVDINQLRQTAAQFGIKV